MTETTSSLQHFPVSLFAMIMGLGGLTIAWQHAEATLSLTLFISPWLLGLSTALFILLAVRYGLKALKHRDAITLEWAHPVKMSFVPTLSIALIILSIAWFPYSAPYSKLLWLLGTALHLVLTLHVITQWMHHDKFELTHLNPAWFIPVVGNVLVPIVGVQHAPIEMSWFFFSIGLIFWPLLLAIIFNRVIFHGTLPERLLPTLFILIAPPAVAFLAYVQLIGEVDGFARILYYAALFFTLLLAAQLRWFARLAFTLTWWAYSFPLAAITIASITMFEHTGDPLFLRLASILLAITSVVIAALTIRTASAWRRGEICVAD